MNHINWMLLHSIVVLFGYSVRPTCTQATPGTIMSMEQWPPRVHGHCVSGLSLPIWLYRLDIDQTLFWVYMLYFIIILYLFHFIFHYSENKCKEEEFRCHVKGNCVPVNSRCNGTLECGGEDFSDEQNCCKSKLKT